MTGFEPERNIHARRRHGLLKGVQGLDSGGVQWLACYLLPVNDLELGEPLHALASVNARSSIRHSWAMVSGLARRWLSGENL